MRFKFLIIKRFSGGVVGEPGFPTKNIILKHREKKRSVLCPPSFSLLSAIDQVVYDKVCIVCPNLWRVS